MEEKLLKNHELHPPHERSASAGQQETLLPEHTDTADCATDLEFPVRYGEIGENGVATLSALGNWLQEAAGRNAEALGFGENALLQHGVTWVLTRLVLRMDRLPREGEHLRIHTWPAMLDRFGHRGYEVYDEKNRLIVSGGSAWSVMRLSDRSLSQLPAALVPKYPSEPRPCPPFACRVIPRLRAEHPSHALLRVRRDDLDINGHVNNTRYMAWLMETFPPFSSGDREHAVPLTPRLVDITFRAECFPQEELECLCASAEPPAGTEKEILGKDAPWTELHSIRRIGDNEEVCRALTLWEENPECPAGTL